MNWDAAGAVAEILGAIAVVISVIYLATQIRHGIQAATLAATRELSDGINEAIAATGQDETTTRIWLMGVRDPSKLNPVERYRFQGLVFRCFAAYQQQFVHLREQSVDLDFYEAQLSGLEGLLEMEGIRELWRSNQRFVDKRFREHVNHLIASKPLRDLEEIDFETL